MHQITRHRSRPDSLRSERRTTKRGRFTRIIYLSILALLGLSLLNLVFGNMLVVSGSGLVTRDTRVVAPTFEGTVVSLNAVEGQTVDPGAVIARLTSEQMHQLIVDLKSRVAQAKAELARTQSEVREAKDILPAARANFAQARAYEERISAMSDQGLSTSIQQLRAAESAYRAQREVRQLEAGLEAGQARVDVQSDLLETEQQLLENARRRYGQGMIITETGGLVTTLLKKTGSHVTQGEPILELLEGSAHVLAYMPPGALYDLAAGDQVTLRYGLRTIPAHIAEVKPVARRLPAEFQQTFSEVDRQRLVRVAFDEGGRLPPMLTKVEVTSPYAPMVLVARAVEGIRTAFVQVVTSVRSVSQE